ncbi:MAG: glutamate racemase [Armatimonadetes bacterium]|nr:glutamate racemase [Armatimonadota bacterium]
MNSAPIGLFDSGVGGLTVARELMWRLPAESLLYYGDTAHVPYGDRTADEITAYGVAIAEHLAHQGCKLIVVACNTVSALALDAVRAAVAVPVVGMITGGAKAAADEANGGTVGVLATAATVRSGAYPAAVTALKPAARVAQVACPRFVPLIEAGRCGFPDSYEAVCDYVGRLPVLDLDVLVLGCTHYAFLASAIRMKLEERTYLVDPAFETAKSVEQMLMDLDLLAAGPASHRMLASGSTDSLTRVNETFFAGRLPAVEAAPVFGTVATASAAG